MTGPLEIVGDPDAPSCSDGTCTVPDAHDEPAEHPDPRPATGRL